MKVVEVAENTVQLMMFPQKVGQASSLSLPTKPNNSRQAGSLSYFVKGTKMSKMHCLRFAHHQFNLAVERLYCTKPFTSDEERLKHLFKLCEEMIKKEQLV